MAHPYLSDGIPIQGGNVGSKLASSPLVISKFYVKSDIRFRFATTVMSTTMFNTNPNSSTEATFSAELPEKAYISYFTMTIGERVIVGEVKEKKQAKEKYDSATARGQTAALVSEVPRETNRFDISVNVAASSSVLFNLTYVEVLERKLSCYRHILNIKPNQIVEDYLIHVSINESRKIKDVKVPQISTDVGKEHFTLEKILQSQLYVNITYDVSGKSCYIMYMPTIQQQKEIHQDLGVNGQFSVFYDVSRQDDAGDILVSNGYFLHFFAPDPDKAGVTILPKHIVFILDTSGSMSGQKIMQLKDAMVRILGELNNKDCFNIIQFNHKVKKWRNNIQNIGKKEEGKRFVNRLKAVGGTDIGRALLEGLSMLKQNQRQSVIPTIFFLTDGMPQDGERNTHTILEGIRQQNRQINSRIYSLAFGNDADLHFLQQLSSDHGGACRKIYMDSDADLQVSGFYKEISSPLLSHLNITYMDGKKDQEEVEITQSLCQLKRDQAFTGGGIYYSGDEYVVCGRAEGDRVIGRIRGMKEGRGMINMKVEGRYLEDKSGDTGQAIEKVWVCLTIKRILAEMDETSSMDMKENLRNEALRLSLKYGLVTTLTSMVVTEENADEKEIEKYKEIRNRTAALHSGQTLDTGLREICDGLETWDAEDCSLSLPISSESFSTASACAGPAERKDYAMPKMIRPIGTGQTLGGPVRPCSLPIGQPIVQCGLPRGQPTSFALFSLRTPCAGPAEQKDCAMATFSRPMPRSLEHTPTSRAGPARTVRTKAGIERSSPAKRKSQSSVIRTESYSTDNDCASSVDLSDVATVKTGGSTFTTLYDGRKDSAGSDLSIRGDVKDSLVVEIFIEYSTYTINITPQGISVTKINTGHRQSHAWEEKEVQVGVLKIMIHPDMLEIEVEGENKLKFRINTEENVEGMGFLYFKEVSQPNM